MWYFLYKCFLLLWIILCSLVYTPTSWYHTILYTVIYDFFRYIPGLSQICLWIYLKLCFESQLKASWQVDEIQDSQLYGCIISSSLTSSILCETVSCWWKTSALCCVVFPYCSIINTNPLLRERSASDSNFTFLRQTAAISGGHWRVKK